jgi:hypothetical protein
MESGWAEHSTRSPTSIPPAPKINSDVSAGTASSTLRAELAGPARPASIRNANYPGDTQLHTGSITSKRDPVHLQIDYRGGRTIVPGVVPLEIVADEDGRIVGAQGQRSLDRIVLVS